MKLTFLLVIISSITFAQQNKSIVLDKIVAQIGENIILQSDIESQKSQLSDSIRMNSFSINCELLENLLKQNLFLNQAELDSIKITDAHVDGEMENRIRVIEQQIGGRQKMEEFYNKTVTQIKNEFRPLIKNRLLTEEMQRQITSSASITPKEIELFYKNLHPDSIPFINAKISIQQIVIFPTITQDDRQITINKLKEIREDILKGKSFETQARIHSQDPGSAPQGGQMTASRGMMVPPFEAAVFGLKEGEISNVFETDYGYHIVQLLERKGDDYTCRHILLIPEFNRQSLSDASNKMEECFSKLKQNQITWEQAVLMYSNDNNTKHNRGIITNPMSGEQGWSMEDLNQIDQQIFLLTNALNAGDLTKPSLYFDFNEKKQGIRIVRLMDRVGPHKANLEQDYTLIQRATESDKKEKILSNWIKSKIGNAYIRIDKEYENCNFKYSWKNN
jgi:peptidyl-prolyl cis-trans isomerase SurA